MKSRLLIFGGVLALGASLQASTSFNFEATDFTDASGAAQTFVSGSNSNGSTSVTGTVTAYSAAAYNGSGNEALAAASIGTYGAGYGMGVCDLQDSGGVTVNPNCSSPGHQMDNGKAGGAGYTDFILITFSTAVDLSSIQLGTFGSDPGNSDLVNMSYWTNVTATVVNGVTIYNSSDQTSTGSVDEVSSVSTTGETTLTCDANTGFTDSCPSNGNSLTYGATNQGTGTFGGTDVTSLLISAQYANITSADTSYFKVQDLTVTNYSAPATPEPASFFLIGSGLLAGGVFGRRRMLKSKN